MFQTSVEPSNATLRTTRSGSCCSVVVVVVVVVVEGFGVVAVVGAVVVGGAAGAAVVVVTGIRGVFVMPVAGVIPASRLPHTTFKLTFE